jgi:hypothetical protein
MRMSRRVLSAAACLAAVSCSLDEPVSEVTLAVTFGVSAPTVPTGGTIEVSVTARNYGSAPVTLSAPSQCLLFFQVHAVGGNVMFRSFDECVGNSTTQVIPPGEEFSMSFQWDGRGSTGARLVGGTYLLRAGALLGASAILGSSGTINVE